MSLFHKSCFYFNIPKFQLTINLEPCEVKSRLPFVLFYVYWMLKNKQLELEPANCGIDINEDFIAILLCIWYCYKVNSFTINSLNKSCIKFNGSVYTAQLFLIFIGKLKVITWVLKSSSLSRVFWFSLYILHLVI